jgi:hypothetical protein
MLPIENVLSCHKVNDGAKTCGVQGAMASEPPRVDYLDMVGTDTPSMNENQEFTPLTREPGRAVAQGRVLVRRDLILLIS